MAELPERLREAAGAHRPDRERMLARVESAMRPTGQPAGARYRGRPQALWVRIAAVTAAAAGAIGLGSLAVGAVSDTDGSRHTAAASGGSSAAQPPPATGGGPQPPAARRGAGPAHRHGGAPDGHRAGSGHSSGSPAAPAVSSSPAPTTAPPRVSGPMAGDPPPGPGTGGGATATGVADAAGGSNWSQSDVRLTTHQEISALTVELRVARTNGVADAGSSTSIPQRTTVSVVTEGDYLVYRWSLDRGQTLAADTYTFAGRFGHAPGGRDTSRDGYAVAGIGRDGPIALRGGF